MSDEPSKLVEWFPVASGVVLACTWGIVRITKKVRKHYQNPVVRKSDLDEGLGELRQDVKKEFVVHNQADVERYENIVALLVGKGE